MIAAVMYFVDAAGQRRSNPVQQGCPAYPMGMGAVMKVEGLGTGEGFGQLLLIGRQDIHGKAGSRLCKLRKGTGAVVQTNQNQGRFQ